MQIVDLCPDQDTAIQQTSSILLDCFGHLPSGYPTLKVAIQEVQRSFAPDRISRVAINETGDLAPKKWTVKSSCCGLCRRL